MPDGTISALASNANALGLVDNFLVLHIVFTPLTADVLTRARQRFLCCKQARCLRERNLLQDNQCYGKMLLTNNKCY